MGVGVGGATAALCVKCTPLLMWCVALGVPCIAVSEWSRGIEHWANNARRLPFDVSVKPPAEGGHYSCVGAGDENHTSLRKECVRPILDEVVQLPR